MNPAGALGTHREEENRNGRTRSDRRVQWLNQVREEEVKESVKQLKGK